MAKNKRPFSIYDNFDFPDYEFQEYPKILYKSVDGVTLQKTNVESPSEERALGAGWFKTPVDALAAGKTIASAKILDPAPAVSDKTSTKGG